MRFGAFILVLVIVLVIVLVGASRAARAWTVKTTREGEPLRWSSEPIVIEVGPVPWVGASSGPWIEGVAADAFQTWARVLPEALRISVTRASESSVSNDDGRNVVHWVTLGWDDRFEKGALAVTVVTHDSDSGRILDADIAINAERYSWWARNAACDAHYDLASVLTHEAGHLLGLAHEDQRREATMYPSTLPCSMDQRDLSSDDVAGVRYLYQELGPIDDAGVPQCGAAGHPHPGFFGPMISCAACLASSRWCRRSRIRKLRPRSMVNSCSQRS